jgi:hypothetical protein
MLEMPTQCRHAVRGFRDFATIASYPDASIGADPAREQGEVI